MKWISDKNKNTNVRKEKINIKIVLQNIQYVGSN